MKTRNVNHTTNATVFMETIVKCMQIHFPKEADKLEKFLQTKNNEWNKNPETIYMLQLFVAQLLTHNKIGAEIFINEILDNVPYYETTFYKHYWKVN